MPNNKKNSNNFGYTDQSISQIEISRSDIDIGVIEGYVLSLILTILSLAFGNGNWKILFNFRSPGRVQRKL